METQTLASYLDDPRQADRWLQSLGLENLPRSLANLAGIAEAGVPLDLLSDICSQLERALPELSDADMAVNNLERFVRASRSPLSLASLFQREPESLRTLLQILSTSQYLSDTLVRDPESLDLLRVTEGQAVARQVLVDEICAEVEGMSDERQVMRLLRRYKHRETLRIAYGDIVRRQSIEVVTQQISYLAEAICEAAVRFARRHLVARRGEPRRSDGEPARFVALALGKLGGEELNYSSDIDLMFLCDGDARTDGPRPIAGQEFFSQMARLIVRLLTENVELGAAYRVDLRLRPHGGQGQAVISRAAAMRYYDVSGRTWERQAFVKARAVAGNLELGRRFLRDLQPWIYSRYLSRADIAGIKALKRKIERRSAKGDGARDVKAGHGGIRDIEFVIQFLQLLNGGDSPQLRTGNTLEAIRQLEQAQCLTMQERTILEENYALLRKVEHRLQIMFDLQTHSLPDSEQEMARLAVRTGYQDEDGRSALAQFREQLSRRTELNRKILDHLLHDAFRDDEGADPVTDLVLDPQPGEAAVEQVLAPYGFQDVPSAYRNLMALATERIAFLSTRRCRHFLAAIAPRLLAAVADTPDPDGALVRLSHVSDSLGGKGVLWELFSFSPATLQLYVRLCAAGDYLANILTSSPGMVDELMDSLVLDRLTTLAGLQRTLDDLCRGAEDMAPILHSFKNSQHLRVGVHDILGKIDVQQAHAALSDVAEALLSKVTNMEFLSLADKHGPPVLAKAARPCEFVVLALGKLGGREPNYHSDLDIVFLYEGSGQTEPQSRGQQQTTNQHFFSQLGQRIIKRMTKMGPSGRLYELDPRLRPTGRSGSLAVSLGEFVRYFVEQDGQLWERQALCKARVVYGSDQGRERVMQAVRQSQFSTPWSDELAGEIRAMRMRLQETASARNIKRGPGGTMDVEFLTQMLQLKHGADQSQLLAPGTLDALAALGEAGLIAEDDRRLLDTSYRLLRRVEARLRLLNTAKRHDLPPPGLELEKLAYLLEMSSQSELEQACRQTTGQVRAAFDRLMS